MKSNQQIQIQKYSIAIKMSTSQIRFTLRKVSSRRCSLGSHKHYFLQTAATTISNLTFPVRDNNAVAFDMGITKPQLRHSVLNKNTLLFNIILSRSIQKFCLSLI